MKHAATLNVNGMAYPVELEGDATLLDAIREDIGLTGTKTGCDDCECGACMVMVDGRPVNSCTYLALQAQGSEITTVEGLADGDELSAIQSAFLDQGGVQCGYCTPGMLVSAHALLRHNPDPSEEEIRLALSGNLCRCTGYAKITEAVMAAKDCDHGGDVQKLVNEIADLWFHSMIALAHYGRSPADVVAELTRREGLSGLEEKALRKAQAREISE